MVTPRKIVVKLTLGTLLLAAWPALGQETCADYPELDSCNTTPVGVCDAAAAASFVIDEGNNSWVVLPAQDDPLYPGQCSYEDDTDPFNERRGTAKDDTNNLQCALDFAAARRTEERMQATITLQAGSYCVRDGLVGLDFSGTIQGAGRGKTTLDFDNPALKDENGHLTGEGGFRTIFDVSKSVIAPNGEPVPLQDRVLVYGDEPGKTLARRYYVNGSGALTFANNRFNSRKVIIRDLHFNAGKGTRRFGQTIHGFTNLLARPLSLGSFVADATELGAETHSFGGRSDELFFMGCSRRAGRVYNYNIRQPWYAQETGTDLTALDPDLCVVPLSNPSDFESPVYPRNCGPDTCAPYAYDLETMPSITTRFIRINATARGNTNNGLYYLNGERNLTIDQVVSGDELVSLNQPVALDFTLKESVLRGLSSEFVGSLFDFGETPIVGGRVSINNNVMNRYREGEELYGCGRIWERLSLSDSSFFFSDNTLRGCQGTVVRHARIPFLSGRGIDAGHFASGGTSVPIPGLSRIRVLRNDYRQGPVLPGAEDGVASFFSAIDLLNSAVVAEAVGVPLPTLDVSVRDNIITTANYTGEQIRPFYAVPVSLIGTARARVRDNVVSGANAAAISIGMYPEDYGSYDTGTRVIENNLSGFNVIPCDAHPAYSDPCSTGSARLDEAANAKVWLGPNVSNALVVVPEDAPYAVGDLGAVGSANKIVD